MDGVGLYAVHLPTHHDFSIRSPMKVSFRVTLSLGLFDSPGLMLPKGNGSKLNHQEMCRRFSSQSIVPAGSSLFTATPKMGGVPFAFHGKTPPDVGFSQKRRATPPNLSFLWFEVFGHFSGEKQNNIWSTRLGSGELCANFLGVGQRSVVEVPRGYVVPAKRVSRNPDFRRAFARTLCYLQRVCYLLHLGFVFCRGLSLHHRLSPWHGHLFLPKTSLDVPSGAPKSGRTSCHETNMGTPGSKPPLRPQLRILATRKSCGQTNKLSKRLKIEDYGCNHAKDVDHLWLVSA